jgi:protein gp37
MAKESKIQWTEASWNPWHGCRKVSAGCKYCYMFRDKERYGHDPTNVLRSKTKFNDPLKWVEPKLIFTCSWSDWFIEDADEWRPKAWEIIRQTPQHIYQILTKRPERMSWNLPPYFDELKNVWIGVSVENNEWMRRWTYVARFISAEPLIAPIYPSVALISPEWVIIGGESGNESGKYKYRPCEIGWIETIINYRKDTPKKYTFVKQLGTHLAKKLGLKDRHGANISEWPEHLRVREMPPDFKLIKTN